MTEKNYFYGRQLIDATDIDQVVKALQADMISQGATQEAFERRVASYCGAKHCLAVANGTVALHLTYLALGLTSEDLAWTSPLTFVATANAMRHCGAKVGFVDIDPETLNLSPFLLERQLEQAAAKRKLPKIIVPVHFAGLSCDMKALSLLCRKYDVKIIEDACHALGGDYDKGKIGNCRYSEATIFSLHPVKSITTGEGGLILTNNTDLYETIKSLRAHGLIKGECQDDPWAGPWHVEMGSVGYNCKITEFQCALGLSQLSKLDDFLTTRRELAARYRQNLADLPFSFQLQAPGGSANHIMPLRLDFESIGIDKRTFYSEMAKCGIHLALHYYPVHLNKPYRELGFAENMFPEAERYYREAFSFPLHPGLTAGDVDHICESTRNVLERGMA